MAKSRLNGPGEPDFFSVADLRTAFETFEVADSLRLEKAGRYLGWIAYAPASGRTNML